MKLTPVIVCTDKRAVVFGFAKKDKPNKNGQIVLHGRSHVPVLACLCRWRIWSR